MRFQSLVLITVGLLGLAPIASTPSFAAGFHACYALKNSNEVREPRIPLDRVCLSDDGRAALYGSNGFRYEFHVDAEFQPSQYGCHISGHTGDVHCGYSWPSIRFSGDDGRASIEADIETPLSSQELHSSSFVWLDIDRYVFDPFRPIQQKDETHSYRVRPTSSIPLHCDPRTDFPCHPCSCANAGGFGCSSWPAHCK